MSEMTSVVEQQHQQQQYVGGTGAGSGSASDKLCCKDCGMNFDSSISLDVHLRYHQHNLLNQWASQANQQEESNNNNSKAGNHNSGGAVKRDSVTAPADSSESASRPASEGSVPPSSGRLQQPQHHQEQGFNQHFAPPMFNDPQYFMHSDSPYILPHQFSPDDEDDEAGAASRSAQSLTSYARYHPYQHAQHQHFVAERANSVSSTSPRSPLQCDKCGAVYEDASQLAEHARSSHPGSPTAYPSPAQTQQYQQLAGSPQQQQVTQSQQSQAQTQQQQMHASPPQVQSNQQQRHPQQPGYDFSGGVAVKNEIKQEPEEQAEILDLDSHKVQTHRYEEEFMRLHHQHQHQQEMHVQMQHQVMQQHQSRGASHSVTSMLSWPPGSQPHDYLPGMSPMGPMDSVSPVQDNQFMRGQQQHMPPVEPPRHPSSPIITSTQPMPGHPISTGLMQQNPKPPPIGGNQSWKSNEARRPKTYNCTACNKWFTSSGHLKRHYNTTLHKNAVKQSNQPDPANMPISAHHHPGRETSSGRAGTASRNSPELSSSSSPPNLMAGPSGEATRGLLHTPTTTTAIFNSNNSSSNSNSSNEATPVQVAQKSLQQQQSAQQQQPQQQQQSSTVMMVSDLVFLGSPASSPMAQAQHQQQHHQQQMGSSSPQLGQQQLHQQQHHHHHHHHMSTGSPSQIASSAHHPMNSPMSPLQQHPVHMSSPSPMASAHHHMSSPSPVMAGVVPASMASPPPGAMMGGTTMPHQPYPNALPPHVITITSIPGLLESITSQLTTTGNSGMQIMPMTNQQHQHQEMLPGFGTFSNHHQHQQKLMPSFSQFGCVANGFTVGQDQTSAVNVGGLSPEESVPPQERSFESSVSSYDIYRSSPPRYECLGGMDMMQTTDGTIIVSTYSQLQQQQQQQEPQQSITRETNNNLPHLTAKEDINPNIVTKRPDTKEEKNSGKVVTKEHQVTSTNTGSHYISVNGLHKCIECDKVFNKACYLTQHNKSFHSGDKPFKCNQCGKRFPHEYLHAEHLQKHAGDKPYKCEICPKQFNHKTDLRRHMCLHTGEKPYACDNCGKGFIRKDHMMKHLETHKKKSNNHHKLHLRA